MIKGLGEYRTLKKDPTLIVYSESGEKWVKFLSFGLN